MSDFLWSLVLRRSDAGSRQWLKEAAPRRGDTVVAVGEIDYSSIVVPSTIHSK
jgi:hypothetical protein